MTQAAALRKRVTHAVLASVAIFALSITYWGLNTFQQSEASITTDRTTITFEEFAAPRLLGTQNEYVDKGVKFSNDAGQTDKTTALTKEGAQCTNGVFTAEQLATSGTNRLHPYPNVSDPLVITFTENRVTTDVSLQLLGVGDAKNLVEFFDHTGALIEKKEYVNPGTGAGCDKKQLVSLTKPNIAKIRISQPGNNFAVTQDGLGIDDLSFAILGEPIVFTVTPTTGTIPLTVKATYTISTGSSVGSTTIPPSSVVSWGDGQTTTLSNTTVEHTYTTAGIYSVVLTVSGQKVGEQTITASDTVQQDPSVVFSASKDSYSTGEIVQLTLRNGGPGTVELPNGAPFDIKRTDGASVFAPIATQAIKPLPAGQSTSWTWNQRDDADKQVADGSYVAT
ncbi:MAG: PKD domain-containing protein, partial [Patescibacteria group bacterium]